MRALRSDAKFDGREVFVTSLRHAEPVYHRIPDWHNGEGRRGREFICNGIVYAGTETVYGNNGGVRLPQKVVTPCGRTYLNRSEIIGRTAGIAAGLETTNDARMAKWGLDIPLGHAVRIGRPCAVCFPGGA